MNKRPMNARRYGARPKHVLAFEFLVPTTCRSPEIRGARWDETALEGAVWRSPPNASRRAANYPTPRGSCSRRKKGPHTGPPSHGEVDAGAGDQRSATRIPLQLSRRCGHTGQPRELAEATLAHTIRNRAEAVHARTDLLERRRALMETWRAIWMPARPPADAPSPQVPRRMCAPTSHKRPLACQAHLDQVARTPCPGARCEPCYPLP